MIIIKDTSAEGTENKYNSFFAARFEANRVDVDNHNKHTEFYASNVSLPHNGSPNPFVRRV